MKQLINDGWSFLKLPTGSDPTEVEQAQFVPVDLPHDWLIWQNDLYESADAWYRRAIKREEVDGKVVSIHFDGVYMDCDILLNGEIVFTHPYGYTAFDVPVSGKLQPGINILMVHIRHHSPNSRWYSGSGIYRDVFLVVLPENHIVPDSLYLSETEHQNGWAIEVFAEAAGKDDLFFRCLLKDQNGEHVTDAEGYCRNGQIHASLFLRNARTWSIDDPYLYTLTLIYGAQTEVRKIGLRSVSIDPDRGLILNHRHVKLHGVCLHHDLGALGAAFHEKAARRQLQLMRKMGANAVRTSHNPPAAKFLDLCDELGMLVVDEAFDMWEQSKTEYDYARFFRDWAADDVASWIRRDRCHPCVVMWSIGNEIYDMHADAHGADITKFLAEQVRMHDPKRHAFVTFGCNYMPWEGGQRCAEYVDAVGYNYGEKLYRRHHADHPKWVLYGSETGSLLSSRGIYHFPMEQSIMSDSDEQCSALGNSNTSWGADSLPKLIGDDLNNDYTLGQFIWTGIDYIGEPTPYHTRSSYFGQADTACFPKDSYYLFQCCWTEQKRIHIGVSWDWNREQMIDVPVMTNAEGAELFLNGKSLGIKNRDSESREVFLPVWKVPYAPGVLRAVAYDKQGNILCEDRQATPGETDHLILEPEDPYILSDGWDISFIRIQAVDANGNHVSNARNRVTVSVSGGGRLIGTDNGDSTDSDSYKSGSRRLFSGKLLLMIGSNGNTESVHITVSCAGCPDAEMTLPVRYAERIQGVSHLQCIPVGSSAEYIPVRRIDICAKSDRHLCPEQPVCVFHYRVLPENADSGEITWQITNAAAIPVSNATLKVQGSAIIVTAKGDGLFYLRGLWGEKEGKTDIISQIEFRASGFGCSAINPYEYVSAGLYDFDEGEIGCGNEKGISFAREGMSLIGFSRVDFGETGADTVSADFFALNGERYEIELLAGKTQETLMPVAMLSYQKPSIWNVYQEETWKLPVRLEGIQAICFRSNKKIHMKGFRFEEYPDACTVHNASQADHIYGDSYRICTDGVYGIGNNVTLTWDRINFGTEINTLLEISGSTDLPVNTIHIRILDDQKNERISIADFRKNRGDKQRFEIPALSGRCSVSFIFLPGSRFDFREFRFIRQTEADSAEDDSLLFRKDGKERL